METFSVMAIGWSGCGDGLIAAGTEVVLWIRNNDMWEMSWKSRAEVPQSLVSTTLFAQGPVATATGFLLQPKKNGPEDLSSFRRESSNCVLVHHHDANSGIARSQLCHPQPVLMIQWRPQNLMQSHQHSADTWRDVLLTCCLDGTVRLWSEIEYGKSKKLNKERHGTKTARQAYHVIGVIEVNQPLKGSFGIDIDVRWATEYGGVITKGEGNIYFLRQAGSGHKQVGRCDWLVGVGPNLSVTFWSVHCLDDISPTRFPRVALWKKQNLLELKELNFLYSKFTNTKELPILLKVVAARNYMFGPPMLYSLLHLLPDNSVSWTQIYTSAADKEESTDNKSFLESSLLCSAVTLVNEDGHSGNIIKVAVHPYSSSVELAASLDSNGLLLIWSLSMLPACLLTMQRNVHTLWKLVGRISLHNLYLQCIYSCLLWAPSVLDDKQFLLVGHIGGVDCFIFQVSLNGEILLSEKMFTIPFDGCNIDGDPPDEIFATPLSSKSENSCNASSFLLLCIWKNTFKLLSWKVVLHSKVAAGTTCDTISDSKVSVASGKQTYVNYGSKCYYATFVRKPSDLPAQKDDVTCVDLVSPYNSALPPDQFVNSSNGSRSVESGYHIATGCSDGTLKLWKVSDMDSVHCTEAEFFTWELVGKFTAHQGPISAVSSANSTGKIATASNYSSSGSTRLHIWQPVWLIDCGSFLLEDVIILEQPVVSLSWLSIGNGQLLLGICCPNQLRIYSQRRFSGHLLAQSQKPKDVHVWHCVASFCSVTIFRDFFWGPKLTCIIVHDKHFSVFSQWLFRAKGAYTDSEFVIYESVMLESSSFATATGESKSCSNKTSKNSISKKYGPKNYAIDIESDLYGMADIVDTLNGSLALYHPEALIQYIYSGNWNRARIVVKHLVESITPKAIPENNMEVSKRALHYVPEVPLSNFFEENNSKVSYIEGLSWGKSNALGESFFQFQGHGHMFGEVDSETNTSKRVSITLERSEIMGFIDILERFHDIANVSDNERTKILSILDILTEISDTSSTAIYRSLDEAGRRFWVAVRFQHQHFIRKFGKSTAAEEVAVDSKLIAWAFQSDCQDDLLSSILSTDPSWLEMRNLGVGYWYNNASQLRTRMEKLARSQYLKSKNPKDCALLYLALNRLQVLAGLFRISKDEKDKVLFEFLSRDFKEEKNKAAALKNAYVLMGRHQLDLAVAFFLLGGDPSSAVTACAKNLGDKQLALVICRLLEGYGSSLERHLISNVLLPDAIDRGDYWLSSLLEWILGNYSQSIKRLINSGTTCGVDMLPASSCLDAFSDPDIGQYSMIAAVKNSFRFSVGEHLAASFSKFATFLAATALNRCGMPLEALEYLSSTLSIENTVQQDNLDVGNHEIFHGVFNFFDKVAINWLLGSVARQFQFNSKLDISLRYISSLLKNYSAWSSNSITVCNEISYDYFSHEDELRLGQLKHDLDIVISIFDKKFSLERAAIANMILLLSSNKGLLLLGLLLLKSNGPSEVDGNHIGQDLTLDILFDGLFVKAILEIICFVARYIMSINFTGSILELVCGRCLTCGKNCSCQLNLSLNNFQTLIYLIRYYIPILKSFQREFVKMGPSSTNYVLGLLEFHVSYTYTRFKKNVKQLILMILPVLNAFITEQFSFNDFEGQLGSFFHQKLELAGNVTSGNNISATFPVVQFEHRKPLIYSVAEEEKWYLIGVSLWLCLSRMVKRLLRNLPVTEEPIVDISLSKVNIAETLIISLEYVTSSLVTQLASFLRHKAIKGELTSIPWLEECARTQPKSPCYNLNQELHGLQLPECHEKLFEILWGVSVSPEDICSYFVKEKVNYFPLNANRLSGSWKLMQQHILSENGNEIALNIAAEKNLGHNTPKEETLLQGNSLVLERDNLTEARRKHGDQDRAITPFQNPKEIFKRSGELFEAVCFNSIHEEQIAVASNKKGLIFFNLNAEDPFREQAEYIWSDSEWPANGWAGCESTPIPTYVSQGVGLGSKKGGHLGLGGATIGLSSLARPGRDLTGGGAFGIPGYAGIGASGLGWGEEEEFEEFRDPPATVDNVHSRAMSRHPSRPFLLVGSSNTHVYLWEFGKDRALATYGVLPAANVPPPYALASVSALQFDHYGQRFATAALDGTVCTWQLEVGGRSNVQPTDSSLFFNSHASDVAYVAASGSILAAAGCSTNGVNVVLWDTLAPPATCQVSLRCHEGGTRSISVFDNNVGTGSISPLIVTGGKCGDVGLHDFRFIATGKTKRSRHPSEQDFKSSIHDANIGNLKTGENSSGMLWYIPKAHLGSVTKIATIPNTSLFLTGSRDGDVKLWDAKNSQLVFHWQKLHDRYTFFQPNSRGLGGVVRAAVTDIQVLSQSFLTCGGDGSVKVVQLTSKE